MSDTTTRRHVLAFVPDLFFSSKIVETAQAAAVPLELLDAAAIEQRLAGPAPPSLVILDLGAGERALGLARSLRAAGSKVPILGFFSHVDVATRDAAIAAGVDPVLPRSAFVARLPALLRGE